MRVCGGGGESEDPGGIIWFSGKRMGDQSSQGIKGGNLRKLTSNKGGSLVVLQSLKGGSGKFLLQSPKVGSGKFLRQSLIGGAGKFLLQSLKGGSGKFFLQSLKVGSGKFLLQSLKGGSGKFLPQSLEGGSGKFCCDTNKIVRLKDNDLSLAAIKQLIIIYNYITIDVLKAASSCFHVLSSTSRVIKVWKGENVC